MDSGILDACLRALEQEALGPYSIVDSLGVSIHLCYRPSGPCFTEITM